jgi:hypothetical protein
VNGVNTESENEYDANQDGGNSETHYDNDAEDDVNESDDFSVTDNVNVKTDINDSANNRELDYVENDQCNDDAIYDHIYGNNSDTDDVEVINITTSDDGEDTKDDSTTDPRGCPHNFNTNDSETYESTFETPDTTDNIRRVVVRESLTRETLYTYRNDEVIHEETLWFVV